MNSSDINIRELVGDDYPALISLWKESGLSFRLRGRDRQEKIQDEIAGDCSIFLVAEEDGQIVGSVLGTHDGRKGWINRLAIAPAYQELGVARTLVSKVENRLDKMGIDIVSCLIEDWNKKSIEVFNRLGYERHHDITYFSKRKNPDV